MYVRFGEGLVCRFVIGVFGVLGCWCFCGLFFVCLLLVVLFWGDGVVICLCFVLFVILLKENQSKKTVNSGGFLLLVAHLLDSPWSSHQE